jgi:hypothetical protein
MEAIYSTETSVDIQRTTRRYAPEDDTLQFTYVFERKLSWKDFC